MNEVFLTVLKHLKLIFLKNVAFFLYLLHKYHTKFSFELAIY